MALQIYNAKIEVLPAGFNNLGFTCYYNALLQSLLSCTSFIEKLYEINCNDELVKLLNYTLCNLKKIETDEHKENVMEEISKLGPLTWRAMIQKLARKSPDFAQFAIGQQCAAEGFGLFLQALEEFHNIQNLFIHRRRNKIFCNDCKAYFSQVDEINNIFEVEPLVETEEAPLVDLNKFLLSQTNIVDKDCICTICGVKSEKLRTSTLVMIPEILFVMSKKYKYDKNSKESEKMNIYTNFPETLTFNAKNKNLFVYKAVAQIEHHGSMNGGHYFAICKRKNGWVCLNDTNVTPSEFKPTVNTYIVVYHIT